MPAWCLLAKLRNTNKIELAVRFRELLSSQIDTVLRGVDPEERIVPGGALHFARRPAAAKVRWLQSLQLRPHGRTRNSQVPVHSTIMRYSAVEVEDRFIWSLEVQLSVDPLKRSIRITESICLWFCGSVLTRISGWSV